MHTNYQRHSPFCAQLTIIIFLCFEFIFASNHSTTIDLHQNPPDNYGICAKFTRQFLEEFIRQNSSSLFGWVTAQGDLAQGQKNESHLVVQCLALALSDRDIVVDRTCIMTLAPIARQFEQNESNNNTQFASFVTQLGQPSIDVVDGSYPMLINFWHQPKRDKPTTTPVPCILPIDDEFASKLTWNATVCGIKKTVDESGSNSSSTFGNNNNNYNMSQPKIICRSIELKLKNGTSFYANAFQPLLSQLHAKSPLFFFDENAQNYSFLRGIGSLDNNSSVHLFDKNDCARFANNSDGRVQCAYKTETALLNSPDYTSIRPFTEQDADAAFLMVPLVILSVLITTGMLLTVLTFIVQHKRQDTYHTIN
ncbi:hypothetical protein GPALN_011583 [Globodera pallida]|nr:hypothetical protein GPALN_011583 [Globodera pallida]